MSRPNTDQTRRIVRKHAVRLLRSALGDTVVYAMASRLSKAIGLRLLLRRLSTSSRLEHRQVACQLASAINNNDVRAAMAIARHARRKPDQKAEKIISHRYGFVWMCNPKVASRSIIQALLSVDPEAILVLQKTSHELFLEYPEARDYFSFAFVRDPYERAQSFFRDKLDLDPHAPEWNSQRFFGLRRGMSFSEYCRWLDSPLGSDAFADRHWLSQHKHLEVNGGRPDYIGSYENLQENWCWVLARLGVPHIELPHLNKRRPRAVQVDADDASVAILHRRYTRDFDLHREVGKGGIKRGEALPDVNVER